MADRLWCDLIAPPVDCESMEWRLAPFSRLRARHDAGRRRSAGRARWRRSGPRGRARRRLAGRRSRSVRRRRRWFGEDREGPAVPADEGAGAEPSSSQSTATIRPRPPSACDSSLQLGRLFRAGTAPTRPEVDQSGLAVQPGERRFAVAAAPPPGRAGASFAPAGVWPLSSSATDERRSPATATQRPAPHRRATFTAAPGSRPRPRARPA